MCRYPRVQATSNSLASTLYLSWRRRDGCQNIPHSLAYARRERTWAKAYTLRRAHTVPPFYTRDKHKRKKHEPLPSTRNTWEHFKKIHVFTASASLPTIANATCTIKDSVLSSACILLPSLHSSRPLTKHPSTTQ